MARISRSQLFCSTVGTLLHIFFVAIPKDLWRWKYTAQKSVRGKTIVITGAASGLGKAMAEIFALEHGAKVAIIDVNSDDALETVSEINKRKGVARSWTCDISNAERMEICANEILSEFGHVDIVICNAAILFFGHALQFSASQLQKSLNVNIMGTINTIRAFLRPMEERNDGHIVAISSIAGYCGETYGLAYCPTKFAIRGVMECLEMEMRDRGLYGINFTTLCPYFARTPMITNMGMRPTSPFFPFMSATRCSREMVDAILKEKVIAFIPGHLSIITALKNLVSNSVRMAGREYLNCRYAPRGKPEMGSNELIDLSKNDDYFHSPDVVWKMLSPATLIVITVWWLASQLALKAFIGLILLSLLSRLLESIYVVVLCDQLKFSYACTCKWFTQTMLFGMPSLLLLLHYKSKTS
uniref:Transmembrane protein 254 n=1 Tax=Parascaris univalens TaxID=6257 RepID=A0A915C058_PARUN